jgi:Na+-translocating ferredoxin:NAD+ oxidoreductase subunit B
MSEEIYSSLARALNARSMTYPSVPCPEFYAFAREIFSPGQAQIASSIPLGGATAEQVAAIMGSGTAEDMQNELDNMICSGTVRVIKRDGTSYYELLPLVPGIIELQFMHGRVDARTRRLAQLMKSYAKALKSMAAAAPGQVPGVDTSKARKVSVEQDILDLPTILPYSEVMRLIDEADHVAAGTCVCRHQGDLLDRPCDKPKTNKCMIIGSSARFAADHGLVSLISKDEARQSIDEAEAAGLVHLYANSRDRFIDLLCACCGCHCFILRGVVRTPAPSQVVKADWIVTIDSDACSGCGGCIDRCWMGALRMEGASVTRDGMRCIGCGLCVYVCPSGAMELVQRGTVPF